MKNFIDFLDILAKIFEMILIVSIVYFVVTILKTLFE
jgi:capsular polysaccharide biosynthesis protein